MQTNVQADAQVDARADARAQANADAQADVRTQAGVRTQSQTNVNVNAQADARVAAQVAARFIALVNDNPACRSAYRALLEACSAPVERVQLARVLEVTPTPATFIQSPQNAITTLVRAGVVSETVLVDGMPYDGNASDLLDDEGVSDDANIVYMVNITLAGTFALDALAPSCETQVLFDAKPQHARAFRMVLDACAHEDGATPASIERLLQDDPCALMRDENGVPSVYPSYFTGALEKAGALVWDSRALVWRLAATKAKTEASIGAKTKTGAETATTAAIVTGTEAHLESPVRSRCA